MGILILIIVVLIVLALACYAVSLLPIPGPPPVVPIIQCLFVVIAILFIIERAGLLSGCVGKLC